MGFYKKRNIVINREDIVLDKVEVVKDTAEPIDISNVQRTSAELTKSIDGYEELSDVADEVDNKLETVEETLQEDNVDPIEIAVVQESINNYYRALGLKRNTINISTESIKSNPNTHMQELKLELEGLGDTIKEYAKKAWDKILEFFRKIKEYFRTMFLKLKMTFNKQKSDSKASKPMTKEEKEYMQFCNDVIAAAERELGYPITPVSFLNLTKRAYETYRGQLAPTNNNIEDSSYSGRVKHWTKILVEYSKQNPIQPDYLYVLSNLPDRQNMFNNLIKTFEFVTDSIKQNGFSRIDDMSTAITNIIERFISSTNIQNRLHTNDRAFKTAFGIDPDSNIVLSFPITGLKLCVVTADNEKTEVSSSYLNLKVSTHDVTLNNRLSIRAAPAMRSSTMNSTVLYMDLFEKSMSGYEEISKQINKIESNILGIKRDTEKVYGQPDIDKSVRKVVKDLNTMVKVINYIIESYYNFNSYLVSIMGRINNISIENGDKLYNFDGE